MLRGGEEGPSERLPPAIACVRSVAHDHDLHTLARYSWTTAIMAVGTLEPAAVLASASEQALEHG